MKNYTVKVNAKEITCEYQPKIVALVHWGSTWLGMWHGIVWLAMNTIVPRLTSLHITLNISMWCLIQMFPLMFLNIIKFSVSWKEFVFIVHIPKMIFHGYIVYIERTQEGGKLQCIWPQLLTFMDDLKCTITLVFLMNLEDLRLFIFT
jgi:hypothetical protein